MKKLLSLSAAVALLFSLSSCKEEKKAIDELDDKLVEDIKKKEAEDDVHFTYNTAETADTVSDAVSDADDASDASDDDSDDTSDDASSDDK